jgi:hypothetical protein
MDFDPILEVTLGNALKAHREATQDENPSMLVS